MLKLGITGIPGGGKSTIFTALTRKEATYISEPDVAVVSISDERLDYLTRIFKKEKVVYEAIEFIDVKNNKNLLKNMDILIVVVPFFGGFDTPKNYLEEVENEFIVEDALLCVERCKRIEKNKKEETEGELDLLRKLGTTLEEEKPLRVYELNPWENKIIKGFTFLSIKPCICILNLEEGIEEKAVSFPSVHSIPVIAVYGELEKEVILTGDEEEMRAEFGLGPPLILRLKNTVFEAKNIITFYTVVGKEARAWNIEKGTTAIEAAAKIHSDIAHGFIKAEVVSFDDLKETGSFNEAKHQGKVSLEGKEYEISDGDVIEFRFNV